MGQPPSGWTVTTRLRSQEGSTNFASSVSATRRAVRVSSSKNGIEPRLHQSTSRKPSSVSVILPSGMSRPIEKSGSDVEERCAGPKKPAMSRPMSQRLSRRSHLRTRRIPSRIPSTTTFGLFAASMIQLTCCGWPPSWM